MERKKTIQLPLPSSFVHFEIILSRCKTLDLGTLLISLLCSCELLRYHPPPPSPPPKKIYLLLILYFHLTIKHGHGHGHVVHQGLAQSMYILNSNNFTDHNETYMAYQRANRGLQMWPGMFGLGFVDFSALPLWIQLAD